MSLSRPESFNLLREVDSSRYLLRHAVETIRQMRYIVVGVHPAMTMGSIGLEKLLKIALGLWEVSEGSGWPSNKRMRNYFHSSEQLWADVRAAIIAANSRVALHPFAAQALGRADSDPILPKLLEILSMYGKEGRFYFLDSLSDRPQAGESPERLWDVMEQDVLDANPQLRATDLSPQAVDAQVLKVSGVIAQSLLDFWDTVSCVMKLGGLGDEAIVFGHELDPKLAFSQAP